MEPLITNDAVTFGLLLALLAAIFYTAASESSGWKRFYSVVPTLLLAYFLPALLNWPLGIIAPEWYPTQALQNALTERGINEMPASGLSFSEVRTWLSGRGLDPDEFSGSVKSSRLYFVASRYLLPASLVLLCLSIDFRGIVRLGPKALIMFLTATAGIVIGGPVALLITLNFFPDLFNVAPDELWRGLSTIAGSWIGGGANQAAMKEIFEVPTGLFGTMIVVDIVVANIWLGFLLFGASRSDRIDRWLRADNSAITDLKRRVEDYQASVSRIPTATDLFVLMGVAFGAVALAHFGADLIVPFLERYEAFLLRTGLTSLLSGFFWLIVIATTVGVALSFTGARRLEGVGAGRWGTVFIFILVATIGMQMNLGDVLDNLGLFAVGLIWMAIHVALLIGVARLIRAPFFFVAVGSQANVGGAASAPVVASAFSPALAPVGVLMAVLGYALGTYGALACAFLMRWVVSLFGG